MTYPQAQADPTNVVGRRIGAYAIDGVIMAFLILAVVVPLFLSALETDTTGTLECNTSSFETDFEADPSTPSFCFENEDEVRYIPQDQEGTLTAQVYGIAFLVQVLNLVVLQGLTGASIGKLVVGLRVIRADGRIAGIGWATLRWLLLFVDAFCFFLPGVVLVFVTKGHRRLGDMAASTFVVRRADVGSPPLVPGITGPTVWTPPTPGYGAPSQWTPPPATGTTGTWSPPATPAPPVAPAPNPDAPTWDAARNAYIQYDRDRSAWVQWDDTVKEWRPIDQ